MKKHIRNYLTGITLVSFVLAVTIYFIVSFYGDLFAKLMLHYQLLFFYLFNIIVHLLLLKLSYNKMKRFTSYFMGATLLKLMVYFGIILWLAVSNRTLAVGFIISFFVFYLIFTFYEVVSLHKFSQKMK